MGNFLKRANTVVDAACAIAAVANICLFAFSISEGDRDLQLLSIINLFLLSFRLLRVPNKT